MRRSAGVLLFLAPLALWPCLGAGRVVERNHTRSLRPSGTRHDDAPGVARSPSLSRDLQTTSNGAAAVVVVTGDESNADALKQLVVVSRGLYNFNDKTLGPFTTAGASAVTASSGWLEFASGGSGGTYAYATLGQLLGLPAGLTLKRMTVSLRMQIVPDPTATNTDLSNSDLNVQLFKLPPTWTPPSVGYSCAFLARFHASAWFDEIQFGDQYVGRGLSSTYYRSPNWYNIKIAYDEIDGITYTTNTTTLQWPVSNLYQTQWALDHVQYNFPPTTDWYLRIFHKSDFGTGHSFRSLIDDVEVTGSPYGHTVPPTLAPTVVTTSPTPAPSRPPTTAPTLPPPGPWRCVFSPNHADWLPMRVASTGNIQYLTDSGGAVIFSGGFKGPAGCNQTLSVFTQPNAATLVTCSSASYQDSTSVCLAGLWKLKSGAIPQTGATATVKPNKASIWTCTFVNYEYPGNCNYVPTRAGSDGGVECMSYNGYDCRWSCSLAQCQNYIKTAATGSPVVVPGKCGTNSGGWCLEAIWWNLGGIIPGTATETMTYPEPNHNWACFYNTNGDNDWVPLRISNTPRQDIECLAYIANDCYWFYGASGASACQTLLQNIPATSTTLRCNPEQYHYPTHWCYLALEKFRGGVPPPYTITPSALYGS